MFSWLLGQLSYSHGSPSGLTKTYCRNPPLLCWSLFGIGLFLWLLLQPLGVVPWPSSMGTSLWGWTVWGNCMLDPACQCFTPGPGDSQQPTEDDCMQVNFLRKSLRSTSALDLKYRMKMWWPLLDNAVFDTELVAEAGRPQDKQCNCAALQRHLPTQSRHCNWSQQFSPPSQANILAWTVQDWKKKN